MSGFDPTTRRLIIRRDNARCVRCGHDITGRAASIHHRHLRSHPTDMLDTAANGIILCGTGTTGCHGWAHAHPALARQSGIILPMWQERPDQAPLLDARRGWILLDTHGGWTRCDPPADPT